MAAAPPSEPIQVAGTLWLVQGEGQGRFPRSNSVLVRDRETALVDTGCGLEILRALRGEVDRVLNTHTHPDHTAGNALLGDREILVPGPGLPTAGDARALSERFFDRPELRATWRAYIREQMGFADQRPSGSFPVDGELRVGETLLQVVHTPGHTLDHCCFFAPETRVLISADLDLTRFGPWYGHPECDLAELRRSIAQVRALAPRIVVSAHRPPVREEVDRALERYAAVIEERERRLLEQLEVERTIEELVEAALIYGRFAYAPELMRYWEEQMLRRHLDELVGSGQVLETEAGYRRA